MDTHSAPAHGHDAHGPSAPAARDPEGGFWLGSTLLFLGVLLVVFVRPAAHDAGPLMPERPLAPAAGHAGHAADAHASDEHAPADEHAAKPPRDDATRAAELMAGLAGYGIANDMVPPEVAEDIRFLIRRVADSGHVFMREGVDRSAVVEAEYLLKRWETASTEIFSAEIFIRRVAGLKLFDLKLNRVKFADGTSRPLADWLRDQLKERDAAPPGH